MTQDPAFVFGVLSGYECSTCGDATIIDTNCECLGIYRHREQAEKKLVSYKDTLLKKLEEHLNSEEGYPEIVSILKIEGNEKEGYYNITYSQGDNFHKFYTKITEYPFN